MESSDFSIHVGQRARLYPTRTLYPCASFRALINGTKIILKATESYRGLAAIRERRLNFSNFDSSKRFKKKENEENLISIIYERSRQLSFIRFRIEN